METAPLFKLASRRVLITLKSILVPYNGSEPSKRALEKAIELTELSKEIKITVIYVIPEVPIPPFADRNIYSKKTGDFVTMSSYMKEVYANMRTETLKMLSDKKDKIEKETGVLVEIKAVIGYPSDKIVEYARDHGIDLIVIGTTSLKGISRIKSLGSVARNVSERSGCPVMLVH